MLLALWFTLQQQRASWAVPRPFPGIAGAHGHLYLTWCPLVAFSPRVLMSMLWCWVMSHLATCPPMTRRSDSFVEAGGNAIRASTSKANAAMALRSLSRARLTSSVRPQAALRRPTVRSPVSPWPSAVYNDSAQFRRSSLGTGIHIIAVGAPVYCCAALTQDLLHSVSYGWDTGRHVGTSTNT